jgi:uncharacterized protein (UPF0548 family)
MQTEWRLLKGWSEREIENRLSGLQDVQRNFDVIEEQSWHHYHSEATIGGSFDRAKVALSNYQFSDPDIVVAYYNEESALLGRRFLLEIKVLGLHYLCPTVVTEVIDKPDLFSFRYDTLEGHIEKGAEWFILTRKDGQVHFKIEAKWKRGQLPNWWSQAGFTLLAGRYQRKWHRHAHHRMAIFAHDREMMPLPPDVTFTYHR